MGQGIFGIRHIFIVIILLFIFMDYGGMGYVFTPVLFFVLIVQPSFMRFVDSHSLWILFFSIMFCCIGWINGHDSFTGSRYVQYLFLPILCYISGRFLMRSNPTSMIKFILLFSVSLGVLALISIFMEIISNGFIGYGSRNMVMLGLPDDILIAATGLNARLSMMLASLGLVFVISTKRQYKYKLIAVCLSILSLLCVVRLGSRSGLIVVMMSVIIVIIFNFKRYSTTKLIVGLLLIILIILSVIYFINKNNYLMTFYLDRMDSETYGVNTAGGRVALWEYYGSQIFNYPFGNIPYNIGVGKFAHNIWLDVARVSGIIPMSILMVITVSSFKETWKFIKNTQFDILSRTWILVCMFGLIALFSVEPLLDGVPMLFMFFLFLYGMIIQSNKNLILLRDSTFVR